jgi:protein-S-isoprenylcysteine O-methyltransferase Ste14
MSGRRQVRAIALLPGTVTILVPALILLLGEGPDPGWGLGGPVSVLPALVGAALIAAGLAMWVWTVRLFSRIGRGTLAPWDPTRKLVVEGPYRHVRNPMISAVLAVLLGEAALLGSIGIALWTAAFAVTNAGWFVLGEEPGLEQRFGDEYREYKRQVPRWLPRRTPWTRGP